MAKQFTLGKEERLKSRKLTEQLFSEGKRFTQSPLRVHYIVSKEGEPLVQFGVGVSSKIFKRSVDRNRIKRVVRESYRLQKLVLQERLKEKKYRLNVFFIYTGKELPAYKEIYECTGKCLVNLCEIINKLN